jgi:hypothetical protein
MATEVGLLTCGSSYSPTPSQPSRGQWPALLAFVPAYSGASVRDLHPLPVSLISIARIAIRFKEISSGAANVKSMFGISANFLHGGTIVFPHHDQGTSDAMVIGDDTAGVIVWGTGSSMRGVSRHHTPLSFRRGELTPSLHSGARQQGLFRHQA